MIETKTTKQLMDESNFNYLYPQTSLNKIEKTDNRKWIPLDDMKILLIKEFKMFDEHKTEKSEGAKTAILSIAYELNLEELRGMRN